MNAVSHARKQPSQFVLFLLGEAGVKFSAPVGIAEYASYVSLLPITLQAGEPWMMVSCFRAKAPRDAHCRGESDMPFVFHVHRSDHFRSAKPLRTRAHPSGTNLVNPTRFPTSAKRYDWIPYGENMPTKEEALAERTYKQEGFEVEKRVFYTLHAEGESPQRDELQNHRNSKAIGMLFKVLMERGLLTEEQLDEILLDVSF
jgi:hypothetical protein